MLNLEKALCIANDGRGSPRIAGNSYSPYSNPFEGRSVQHDFRYARWRKQTSVIFSRNRSQDRHSQDLTTRKPTQDCRCHSRWLAQTSRRQIVCYFNLNASRAIRDVSLERLELPPQSETRDEAILVMAPLGAPHGFVHSTIRCRIRRVRTWWRSHGVGRRCQAFAWKWGQELTASVWPFPKFRRRNDCNSPRCIWEQLP